MKTTTAKRIDDERFEVFLEIIGRLWQFDGEQLLELAETAGVHWTTLYNWRTGEVTHPTMRTFIPVAEALGYEVRLVRRKRGGFVRAVGSKK